MKSESISKALAVMARSECFELNGKRCVEIKTTAERLELRTVSPYGGLFYTSKWSGEEVLVPGTIVVPTKALQFAVGSGPFDIDVECVEKSKEVKRTEWVAGCRTDVTEHVTFYEGTASVVDSDGCAADIPLAHPNYGTLPGTEDIQSITSITINDTNKLLDRLEFALLAASNDGGRPHLCSLCCDPDKGFVATDGHRLHITDPGFRVPGNGRVLLHRRAADSLLEVLKLFKHDKKTIAGWFWGKKGVAVVVGSWVVTVSGVDAMFPPYEKVYPADYSNSPLRIVPDYEGLVKTLKKIKQSRPPNNMVVVTVEDDRVRLSVDDSDMGSISSMVRADVSGSIEEMSSFAFGVNVSYLIDAIPEQSTWYVNGSIEPICIEHDLGLSVVMPMRL